MLKFETSTIREFPVNKLSILNTRILNLLHAAHSVLNF